MGSAPICSRCGHMAVAHGAGKCGGTIAQMIVGATCDCPADGDYVFGTPPQNGEHR